MIIYLVLTLVVILLAIITLCYKLKKSYNYWKKKGVYSPKPNLLFGHVKNVLMGRNSLMEEFADIYEKTRKRTIIGIYILQKPALMINSLDTIRDLMMNSEHFNDRPSVVNIKLDPIADNLNNATGFKWRKMTSKMSPFFSPDKIQDMFPLVMDCCKELLIDLNDKGEVVVEDTREMVMKLTTDVLGGCAFGIDCNSFRDPDNEFRRMGMKYLDPPRWRKLLHALNFLEPNFLHDFGLSTIGKDMNDYYRDIVRKEIEYRKKNEVSRDDFFDALLETLEDECGEDRIVQVLAAQAFGFFSGGIEACCSIITFALYELAWNPEIQKKLHEEIKDSLSKNNGEFKCQSLETMDYITQVVAETVRKYPANPVLFRVCTKDYQHHTGSLKIETGTPIVIPVLGIHKNPDIYPDPEKFNPDRFQRNFVAIRKRCSFLPFGEGLRICIGSRFGLMYVNLALAMILSEFEVAPCSRTPIPLEFKITSMTLQSKYAIYLRFKKRLMKNNN